MNDQDKKRVAALVNTKINEIKTIDDDSISEVAGVSQAISRLKEALDKVEECTNLRQFEVASQLGYDDVASEFIFLQRCLGGLNDVVHEKEKLIQDICIMLSEQISDIRFEDVAPSVETKLDSLKVNSKPEKITILLGSKTFEKLNAIKQIRQTPIEHIAEFVLASAMENDEQHWRSHEESKAMIPHIYNEDKESYTSDEVFNHLDALSQQSKERYDNLY